MVRATKKLSARHAKFVVEYLLDLNATQAAIRAGYSENGATVQGTRLLANASIASAIEKARTTALARTDFDRDKVLKELGLLAFSDVDNYMIDEATGKLTAAPGAPLGVMRAVSAVKYRTVTDEEGRVERTVEFRLWDKPGTLKLAGRHLGLFPSKDQAAIEAAAEAALDKRIAAARQAHHEAKALAEQQASERERTGVVDVAEVPKKSEP